jgi:hypothetical protein
MPRNAPIPLACSPCFAAGGGTIDLNQGFYPREGAPALPNKTMDQTLVEIEEAQEALRDSIERARDLTEETERLVLKHRTDTPRPPNPQS